MKDGVTLGLADELGKEEMLGDKEVSYSYLTLHLSRDSLKDASLNNLSLENFRNVSNPARK